MTSSSPPGCSTASAMVRDFFAGRTVRQGGPSNAETYYTLNRFPGWRCGTGAGGGGCQKGRQSISWEAAAGIPATPTVVHGRPRPTTWVPDRTPRLGFGIGFTNLRWSKWGGPSPVARGSMRACAGGICSTDPVQIRLSRLVIDRNVQRVVYGCLRFVRTPVLEIRGARVAISQVTADGTVRC